MKPVHIGKKIEAKAKELRIGPSMLGESLGTSKQNVYSIYKRNSVDAELLQKIGKALNFNFFQYYTEIPDTSKLESELKELRREVKDLREKYELAKKVINKS